MMAGDPNQVAAQTYSKTIESIIAGKELSAK